MSGTRLPAHPPPPRGGGGLVRWPWGPGPSFIQISMPSLRRQPLRRDRRRAAPHRSAGPPRSPLMSRCPRAQGLSDGRRHPIPIAIPIPIATIKPLKSSMTQVADLYPGTGGVRDTLFPLVFWYLAARATRGQLRQFVHRVFLTTEGTPPQPPTSPRLTSFLKKRF